MWIATSRFQQPKRRSASRDNFHGSYGTLFWLIPLTAFFAQAYALPPPYSVILIFVFKFSDQNFAEGIKNSNVFQLSKSIRQLFNRCSHKIGIFFISALANMSINIKIVISEMVNTSSLQFGCLMLTITSRWPQAPPWTMEDRVTGVVYTTVLSTQGDLSLLLQEVSIYLGAPAQKFGILLCLDLNGNYMVAINELLCLKNVGAQISLF